MLKKIWLLVFSLILSSQALGLTPLKRMFLEDEKNTINVFQNNVRSVVNVTNIRIARRRGFFFDFDALEIPAGAGSGFVWDKKGHIVTNSHVVADGDSFFVTFHKDKKQYKAKLVGMEPNKDIAILKLLEFPAKLTPITAGTSKDLVVGQKALAIGNPFGLDHTITTGIVSALGRKIPGFGGVKIHGMIQTDSSINPGNSGGPLLDSSGNLIGINTMIYSQSGSSSGVGFAVPVDTIKRIVPQLIKHGKVIRPGLGIGVLDDYMKEQFGVKEGIVIKYVDERGGAAKAKLRGMGRDRYGRYYVGDIIISIDGVKINEFDDIYQILDKHKVGDRIEVEYRREGKLKKTKVKLIEI